MIRGHIFWSLWSILWSSAHLSSGVSFYGDSLLWVPSSRVYHSVTTSAVSLQFNTVRPSGVIMSSTGATDYLVIELRHGVVQVRVQLGSGEMLLKSPPNIRFDDGQWHSLKFERRAQKCVLTVDSDHLTSGETPGSLRSLNVNRGVYLGRPAKMFAHEMHSFRGCLRNVIYNTHDLAYVAKANADSKVEHITWDCREEFGAGVTDAITLYNQSAFIAFSHVVSRDSVTFSCNIRTRSEDAVLMFNSGASRDSAFIAVEIKGGHLLASIGHNIVDRNTIRSPRVVNDGTWHSAFVTFSRTSLKLALDGSQIASTVTFQMGAALALSRHLYIGGISSQAQKQAERFKLVTTSVIGCVKNIEIGGKVLGFPHAQISRGINVNCQFTFPCSLNPCKDPMQCREFSVNQYTCVCPNGACQSDDSSDSVHAGSLLVDEGQQALISSGIVKLAFDYKRFGLRESSIIFRVIKKPNYGLIEVSSRTRRRRNREYFTLLDLNSDKVYYKHNGEDEPNDDIQIIIDVPYRVKKALPEMKRWNFTLHILVKNINDVPELVLPKDRTLKLIFNSKLKINSGVLFARDNDSRSDRLLYEIVSSQGRDSAGYFENEDYPGMAQDSFSQQDIEEGRISFIHTGGAKAWFTLRLNDGITTTDNLRVHIESFPLEVTPLTNTGLQVYRMSTMVIGRDNLTYTTNVPTNQQLDIRYTIQESPQHGVIQRRVRGRAQQWEKVTSFTQRQVNKKRIRYKHTDVHSKGDVLKFVASCEGIAAPAAIFVVSFVSAQISLVMNRELYLDSVTSMFLSENNLLSTSNDPSIKLTSIYYVLISSPRIGQLRLLTKSSRSKRLSLNSNFTQADILNNRVQYKLHRTPYVPVEDEFQFKLFSESSGFSNLYTFRIRFRPERSDLRVINNGLDAVLEGKSKIITKDDLFIRSTSTDAYHYSIVKPPSYGVLKLMHSDVDDMVSVENITEFSNADIEKERLAYFHDDSENAFDWFLFESAPARSSGLDTKSVVVGEIVGNFSINITLTNDHKPVRVTDNVFTVVKDGQRLITSEDLLYSDADTNFNSSFLQYTRRGIPNGEIVNATNPSEPVYQFLQSDIENGQLLFKHRGSSYGRAVIIVTDGQYYSTGLFEIRATEPFLNITKLTGAQVKASSSCVITSQNISVSTNMGLKNKQIKFVLTKMPKFGKLIVNKQEAQTFSYAQLVRGNVKYIHGGSYQTHDHFEFAVQAKDVQLQDKFDIRILSKTDQTPPTIVNNWPIIVDEGQVGRINRSRLMVHHAETEPSNMRYTVVTQPKHGYLKLLESTLVTRFTQADLDLNSLDYVHTDVGFFSDLIVVDVTNGIHTLRDVEIKFDIIPNRVPLEVRNITVREGASKAILKTTIHVLSSYYSTAVVVFKVEQQPQYGRLEKTYTRGASIVPAQETPVVQFTWSDIVDEFLYYTHDGSETTKDLFVITAALPGWEKRSKPYTIFVNILPDNDEIPVVVRNRKLHAWFGAPSLITNETLLAIDGDTAATSLVYVTTPPPNGILAFTGDQSMSIVEFTQQDVNEGRVFFVHTNGETGVFYFQVNDGVNFGTRETFHIEVDHLVLRLDVNEPLLVYPNTRQPITSSQLKATTNDPNQTHPIIYSVQTKPQYGRIVLDAGNMTLEVTSFTQAEIIKGSVFYEHIEGQRSWASQDKVVFDVSTLYADRLDYVAFDIKLSYEHFNDGNRNQLIRTSPLIVREGDKATINTDVLDVSPLRERLGKLTLNDVRIVMQSLPSHGSLVVNDEEVEVKQKIPESVIKSGILSYQHDDSDSTEDSFNFTVELRSLDFAGADSVFTFNISVTPVNDQRFRLETQTPTIQVVQGSITNITRDILRASDPDTSSDNLVYTLVNEPENGHVAMQGKLNISVKSFTQAHIDAGKLIFVSDGTTRSGTFYFKLTDGAFPAFYKVFRVNVTPLTITIVNNSAIRILQGQSAVTITQTSLFTRTNGDSSNIMYNISSKPLSGDIFVNSQPTRHFSQSDVNEGRVKFVLLGTTLMHDFFTFVVFNGQAWQNSTATIVITPLVKQQSVPVQSGQSFIVTTDMLDASELALFTRSDPYFNITNPPKYGTLVRITRSKREVSYEVDLKVPTSGFFHSDISNKRIVYSVKSGVPIPTGVAVDGFDYVLTATNVPPAAGRFQFNISSPATTLKGIIHPAFIPKFASSTVPQTAAPTYNVVPARDVTMDTELNLESKDRLPREQGNVVGDSNLTLVVVLVCLGVVLVVVVLVVAVAYRRHRKSRDHMTCSQSDEQSMVSMVTPKGVVVTTFRGTSSPTRSNHPPRSPDVSRTEVSPTVPQVRVTPLVYNDNLQRSPTDLSSESQARRVDHFVESTPVGSYKSTSMLSDCSVLPDITLCRGSTPALKPKQYWV